MSDNRVFVLDTNRQVLMPTRAARARRLLRDGKAAVWRMQPFTIILKRAVVADNAPLEFKVDPGSKTTGLAIVADFQRSDLALKPSGSFHIHV